jgi:indolepyruvate decarboxylase
VAAVTYGAGAFNLVNAVAGAYAERVPLVVLSGAPRRTKSPAAICCTTRSRRWTRSGALFEELTVDRRGWTTHARPRSRSRACSMPRCAFAAGLPRDPARHAGRRLRAVPAPLAAGSTPTAWPPAPTSCSAGWRSPTRPVLMVGVEVRRYGSRPRWPNWRGGSASRWSPASWAAACWPSADVPLAGTYLGLAGDPAGQRAGRTFRRPAAAGRDRLATPTSPSLRARIDIRHAIHVFDGDVAMGHHVYHELPIAALVDALLDRCPCRRLPSRTHRAKPAAGTCRAAAGGGTTHP